MRRTSKPPRQHPQSPLLRFALGSSGSRRSRSGSDSLTTTCSACAASFTKALNRIRSLDKTRLETERPNVCPAHGFMSPGSVCWKRALQGPRPQVHHTHPGQPLAPSPLMHKTLAAPVENTDLVQVLPGSLQRLTSVELGSFVLNYTAQLLFTL